MILKEFSCGKKRFLSLQCDNCQLIFERSYGINQHKIKFHFCTRACSQAARSTDGVLRPIMEATMRRKYGDDYQAKISAKIQSSTSPDKRRARTLKARKTIFERYGVNSAVEIPHVIRARESYQITPDVIAKRKATTFKRFGVESVLSLERVHALANTPNACHKRHATMRDNGSYFTSKPENNFYEFLCEKFGKDNVIRQFEINSWPIDFYVKSIDMYVQFDGEYWHGLNRSLEEILRFKTPRDKTIHCKYQIDRRQDVWFKSTNRRLIRITDKQFARGEVPNELKK